MKRLIKETWRHFAVALILQVLITTNWSYLTSELELLGQCLLALVAWAVLNWGFEIYQKNNGGKNTLSQIIEDCISAALGGVVGVIVANIF